MSMSADKCAAGAKGDIGEYNREYKRVIAISLFSRLFQCNLIAHATLHAAAKLVLSSIVEAYLAYPATA